MIPLLALIIILLAGSNIWLIMRVLRPLQKMSHAADALTKGNFDALGATYHGISQIESVRRAMDCVVGHVRRAQEQNKTYAEMLANGQENERARLARELHDDTVQSLIAIAQSIDMAQTWAHTKPEQAANMLDLAHEQALESVTMLRNLIADLRPPALQELGLVSALEVYAEHTDTDIHLYIDGNARRLPETHELVLFRCTQEAITNARRHGNATHLDVHLTYKLDGTHLTITDNGTGFQSDVSPDQLVRQGHYGLMGIQERVDSLNGTVTFKNNGGAVVEIWVPTGGFAQPAHTVRDPVCHAVIEPEQAYGSVDYAGETYYFCCPVCQGAFQKEPGTYLQLSIE